MEKITSRKNTVVAQFRTLAKDADARTESGEFVCDGAKMLAEALASGQEITSVLWRAGREKQAEGFSLPCCPQSVAAEEVFDYAKPK